MAAAITVLLQDEGKRHGCAKNARERIATRFHIKDTIARTAQLFEEALS
jgi:glycosyltransferase involved in cell wall biosynthesis